MKTKCMFFLMGGLLIAAALSSCNKPVDKTVLKGAFQEEFVIGAALNNNQLLGKDAETMALVKKQFNSITPENDLKWERVHPELDRYDFEAPDKMVEFGKKNGMFVVGHVLVWHSQTPDWVFEDAEGNALTRDALLERMKEHIFTVAGRYKDTIHGWDVVNEAINDDGSMRESKWYKIIGEDFIEKAFEFAAEAAPNTELYYNDYNMFKEGKYKKVAEMVKSMKAKGIRIDGVGIQAHWGLNYPDIEKEAEPAIKTLIEAGAKVHITELDITVLPSPWDVQGADVSLRIKASDPMNPYKETLPDSMQITLANRYAEFFELFAKYKNDIDRVTFWGVHDAMSWKNGWPIPGRTDYPLLFDRQHQPKKAFDAVIKVGNSSK